LFNFLSEHIKLKATSKNYVYTSNRCLFCKGKGDSILRLNSKFMNILLSNLKTATLNIEKQEITFHFLESNDGWIDVKVKISEFKKMQIKGNFDDSDFYRNDNPKNLPF